jgi:hypothetical protein
MYIEGIPYDVHCSCTVHLSHAPTKKHNARHYGLWLPVNSNQAVSRRFFVALADKDFIGVIDILYHAK